MKLTDVFERTYVLNLPERVDRRREMDEVFRKSGISWEPGKVELYPAVRPTSQEEFPSIGARGCFLSHLGILKAAREAKASRVLIMEDDLDIPPIFPQVEDKVARRLAEDDWGFAFLGHALPPVEPPVTPGTLIPIHGSGATTHFFAVHGRYFDELIAFLELILTRPYGHPDAGPMHVDGAFTLFRHRRPELLTLVSQPNLGTQRSSTSDITGRRFDNVPVVSDLLRVARNVKRRIMPRRA